MNLSAAANLCKQFGPDQDLQNIGPDLDPNSLTLIVFRKEFFFEKFDFEKKNQQMTTKLDKNIHIKKQHARG